jgi:hypothetical protein
MEFVGFSPDLSKEWDYLVCNSPDGWAFSLSYWLEMVTHVWEIENFSFAVRENGKLVAAMPLHFYPGGRQLNSSGWGHGGPVILRGVTEKKRKRLWKSVYNHVLEIADQVQATNIYTMISPLTESNLSNRWGVNPLIECGFEDVSTHSMMTNLERSEEDLWSGLHENARRRIRQAIAAGYSVQKCSWKDMLDEYYATHVETYTRTGVPPHPRSYFEGIANPVYSDHSVLWVGFDPNGLPVAFYNSAVFGKAVLAHTACSRTDHLNSHITYLLFWEAIRGAKKDGYVWFENGEVFPGAKSGKDKGLTEFKMQFGGEMHRFFRGQITLDRLPPHSEVLASPEVVEPVSKLSFRQAVHNWSYATKDLVKSVLGRFTL